VTHDPSYLIGEFLRNYTEQYEWEQKDAPGIMRRLCEEYGYSPRHGREFIMIAYGWLWGRTGDSVMANVVAALLQNKLDEVYAVVAEENDWKDSEPSAGPAVYPAKSPQ
jgi:hypothetical protein